jgi:transaldolase
MKFFIDTGNPDEVRRAAALGVLDGVTTNPSLLAKQGGDPDAVVREICSLVKGPVSYEVVATTTKEILAEGRKLAGVASNICVKVPCIPDGIAAVKQLSGDGIPTNVTLVFSVPQAIIAAKAGATFVSPFIGRLDDIAHTGMDLIRDLVTVFDNYEFETEILVASVRNPVHVVEAARAGADICTMPFAVIEQLLKHPLTDLGLARFLADHEKARATTAAR